MNSNHIFGFEQYGRNLMFATQHTMFGHGNRQNHSTECSISSAPNARWCALWHCSFHNTYIHSHKFSFKYIYHFVFMGSIIGTSMLKISTAQCYCCFEWVLMRNTHSSRRQQRTKIPSSWRFKYVKLSFSLSHFTPKKKSYSFHSNFIIVVDFCAEQTKSCDLAKWCVLLDDCVWNGSWSRI